MFYNILWLFIDGVRRYKSTDDRSRLDFMDAFGKDSVEFLNVVTSAPSTSMSLSAMVSGMPSYYLNRNFDDFIFDKGKTPSLTQDLKQLGYNLYSFLMHKLTRETMLNILPMIERKYWPKGFSHNQWWNNSDINIAVKKTLSMSVKHPAFFFVDYNCRGDALTSDKVKCAFHVFRNAGYTRENTITILCSDHGYPDPSKETGRPEFYKKHKLSHDLILTDDNIMIPLFIQYPGCPKGKKIETTVSSIDIYPTISDILGIDIEHKIHGKSLLPLIYDEKKYQKMMESRFHRSDSRLVFQTGRGTAIRNDKYKYIFYHDKVRGKGHEEFFDIQKDKYEQRNLVNSDNEVIQKQLNIFLEKFNKSENDVLAYQLKYLFDKFLKNHRSIIERAKYILITDSCNPLFSEMLINMIRRLNNKTYVYLLKVEHNFKYNDRDIKILESGVNDWGKLNIYTIQKKLSGKKIDLLLSPYNTSEQRNNTSLIKFFKKMKARKKMFLDYNMESFKKTITGFHWRKFRSTWHFAKHEPSYMISYLCHFLLNRVKKAKVLKNKK